MRAKKCPEEQSKPCTQGAFDVQGQKTTKGKRLKKGDRGLVGQKDRR